MIYIQTRPVVTLTGVDEKTELDGIEELSRRFSFSEWGLLYSPKHKGHPGRYPSASFIQQAMEKLSPGIRVALHICGSGVDDLVKGEPVVSTLVDQVGERWGRVQLNFNAHAIGSKFTLDDVARFLELNPKIEFITQHNEANGHVWKVLQHCGNHSVLFDGSCGRGLTPDVWEVPLNGVHCGYAGGLGIHTVVRVVHKIALAAGDDHFWIDMETHLRDEQDCFDLDRAGKVLAALDISRPRHWPVDRPSKEYLNKIELAHQRLR